MLDFFNSFIFTGFDKDKAAKYSKASCKNCWGKGYIERDNFIDGNILTAERFISYCPCVYKKVQKIVGGLNTLPEEFKVESTSGQNI